MKKVIVVLASLLISACASTPAPKTEAAATAPAATSADNAKTAATSAAELEASKLAAEVQNLQNQSVYFDFDKSNVKAEFQDVMSKQADFIKSHKNDVVTLEGNTDERGSSEYNLALGSKRAHAVKTSLKIMGVSEAQMKEASLGEEKPRQTCHEEQCWKENRRVDFVHQVN